MISHITKTPSSVISSQALPSDNDDRGGGINQNQTSESEEVKECWKGMNIGKDVFCCCCCCLNDGAFDSTNGAKITQRVATQSFLYVASFALCWGFLLVIQVTRMVDLQGLVDGKYFTLMVLHGMFFPSQGFFNAFVYVRPRYVQWRCYDKAAGRWTAFRKATFTFQNPP